MLNVSKHCAKSPIWCQYDIVYAFDAAVPEQIKLNRRAKTNGWFHIIGTRTHETRGVKKKTYSVISKPDFLTKAYKSKFQRNGNFKSSS